MENPFDLHIVRCVNEFALHAQRLNVLMAWLADAELLKGGVLMAALWWAWFRPGAERHHNREGVLATLVASFIALFAARILASTLPFRARPMFAYPPPFRTAAKWSQVSSFPSDHAVMFFALAAGLFSISKPLGILASLYVLIVVCLPRIYLGLHYPSDVMAGAVLGIGISRLANTRTLRQAIARPGFLCLRSSPSLFYAAAFLHTYQIATLFTDVRNFHGVLIEALNQSINP